MKTNKWSFWTICSIALLCLISMVLGFLKFNHADIVIDALQGIALGIALILIAISAYQHVKKKNLVWKILYVFVVIIAFVCVIIPFFF